MKIKVIGNFIFLSKETVRALKQLGDLEILDVNADEAGLIKYGKDADAIITWGKPTAKMVRTCKQLKFIGYMFTGYDAVVNDPELVQALKENHIAISYAPGYAVQGVSEYAVGALLAGVRKLLPAVINNRASGFKEMFSDYLGGSISGSTAGILGMGNIGSAVAGKLQALGANIISYTKHPSAKKLNIPVDYVSLEELFTKSDNVVITAQLNRETEGLVTKKLLLSLPQNAVVVNAARGKIFDLRGLVAAAGKRPDLQIFVDELDADQDLLAQISAQKNIYVTPHIAAIAMPTLLKCTEICARNLTNFVQHRDFDAIPLL
jgi:phosphoglycerate dehydrogenase-like enzyme